MLTFINISAIISVMNTHEIEHRNILQEKLFRIGEVGFSKEREKPSDIRKRGLGILAVGVTTMLAGGMFGANVIDRMNGAETSKTTHEIVVKPGDTYWGIAQDIPGEVPTGEKVHIITGMNPKVGDLNPGETVEVPDSFNP